MTHLQEYWEGVSLSANYTLEQWLYGDDSAAFFQTSFAPDGRRALVKLVPEAASDSALLDLWQRTRQLRHSNLVELFDCGRADHGGEIVLYAVFEFPEDTLASAIDRAPLNELESREVLDSIINGLRYLHAQGLVLGALDPAHIVAVGDRVKLSTDALREADTSSAYRKDVRLLGNLWQQALMPAAANSADVAAHAADPNPETRWTLAEITAALEPPLLPEPAIIVEPPIPEPIISEAVSAPPVAEDPVTVPLVVEPVEAPVLPLPYRRNPDRVALPPFPKWIFAGAAGILLFIVILALTQSRPAGGARQTPVTSVSLPVEPPAPAPAPTPIPKAAAPKVSRPTGEEIWRVIAFTYRTREAAAKKVQQLNEYHPGLNATVFVPNGAGYYLVSLGGRMTHEEAERVQRTARGKGLPRDLYVQNYSR